MSENRTPTAVDTGAGDIDHGPVVEAPVAEEPVVEAPVAEEPASHQPRFEEPVADDPVASEDADEPKPQAPRSRRTTVVILTVLTLVVVGAGVGAVIWGQSGEKAAPPPTTQLPTTPTLSDSAFVTYVDPETGFTIRYPRGWRRSEAPVREIRLVTSDGKQYSASVRVTRTEVATTPANLANIKSVTDGVVGPGVKVLSHDTVTVNGLIGFRYIYTFNDEKSGLEGAHLHYFLFQGQKMYSIVFEALPTGDFAKIEGTFDQMLDSFRADPDPPVTGDPGGSNTTTPPPPASTPGG